MKHSFVKISGMGCICAPGRNLNEAVAHLYRGERNPATPRRILAELETPYPVFEIDSDLNGFPEETTRTTRLTISAFKEALTMAGLSKDSLKPYRVGVCLGTTVGCTLNNEPFYRDYRVGKFPGLEAINRYLDNNPAQYISRNYQFKGPVATIANACSSGTDAIGLAKLWLENDLCDIAIAGGADELSRITYLGFISLLISSGSACRPFDRNRDGLNLGEGAGILILEKEDVIRKRGGKAIADLLGYGTFADAFHPTAPHPEGLGLKRAIRFALKEAGCSADRIGFVNAHGTSTSNNDKVEGSVIAELFGKDTPVVSTKAYTGHTLGAAGAIEAIFTIQALLDQKLPKTAGFDQPDPECAIVPTQDNMAIEADIGLSNSLAFGGNNSTLIFGRIV